MAMKQDKTWKSISPRKKADEVLTHQDFVSRLVGVGLMLVSLLIFGMAGGISNGSVQGFLGLLGIGVVALGLTLLITGATISNSDKD